MTQRRRSGSFARPILVVLVVILLGSLGYRAYAAREIASKRVAYREVPVEVGDITVRIRSTGDVQPENRLEIKPPIAGRIEEVLVTEGEVVEKGTILAWMSSAERAALLDAARARGPSEVKRWEEFYKATPIISPIAGTIILRNVEPGQTFTTQEAVFVMSDRLTVKAQVDETDLAQVTLDQPAEITLDAYPSESIPGRVVHIAYDATTVNNVTTYVVDVLPDATPEFMRSGMTANVDFIAEQRKDVLVLNQEAVMREADGRATVLVGADRTPAPVEREVKLGLSDGKRVEVVSGVERGEVILVPETKSDGPQQSSPFTPFGSRRSR